MKVLMVGPLPGRGTGGVASVVATLCRSLSKMDRLDVHMYTINKTCTNLEEVVKKADGNHIYTPLRITMNNYPELFRFIGIPTLLSVCLIFSFHNLKGHVQVGPKIPYQYFTHFLFLKHLIDMIKPDIIHAHHAGIRPVISWLACKGKIPIVVTLHSFSDLIGATNDRKIQLEKIYRLNFSLCAGIIAVSHSVRRQALKLDAPNERLVVIPNTVDIEVFGRKSDKLSTLFKTYGGRKYVLYTGNLSKFKGLEILIDAFSRVSKEIPESRLILVGDGPDARLLKELTDKMNLNDKIIFVGEISQRKIFSYYLASDIFVLPSRSEGLSLSLLEAMASGLPVITTLPEDQKHDAVIDGKTGLLVRYGDVHGLAKKIESLLKNNSLALQIGRNARESVINNFSDQAMAQWTYHFYRDIIVKHS